MVYGTHHRSREADVVIWDSQNYPSLPLSDHNFFFAESVRAVLECKSSFSAEEFTNVRVKSKATRDIVPRRDPGLAQAIEMLQMKVHAMQTGRSFGGMMIDTPHIGTGAIFLLGGGRQDWKVIAQSPESDIDDSWPDLCLLLEPGIILLKEYEVADGWMGGRGYLSHYSLGEDALLAFIHLLYQLLFDRSTALETPLNMSYYASNTLSVNPDWSVQFPLTRVVPQNFPFMRDGGPDEA